MYFRNSQGHDQFIQNHRSDCTIYTIFYFHKMTREITRCWMEVELWKQMQSWQRKRSRIYSKEKYREWKCLTEMAKRSHSIDEDCLSIGIFFLSLPSYYFSFNSSSPETRNNIAARDKHTMAYGKHRVVSQHAKAVECLAMADFQS